MVARQLLVAAVVLLRAVHALGPEREGHDHAAFRAFMRKHGRQYAPGSDEYRWRLALFSRRVAAADAHNARPGRLWTAGVTPLSDRTDAELAQLRGWRGAASPAAGAGRAPGFLQRPGSAGSFLSLRGRERALPEELMNWTTLQAAKKATEQGFCGSCWAVATSKVLQLHQEIHRPESPRTFSAQELISCVPNPHKCGGKGGCEGATAELALDWALRRGLAGEDEAPYTADEGEEGTCTKRDTGPGALVQRGGSLSLSALTAPGLHQAPAGAPSLAFGLRAWERLAENSYEALLRALNEQGPVVTAVAAEPWLDYVSGVFDGCKRDAVVDHVVVLLGYGRNRSSGTLYWDLLNSWGPDWGEAGRIRLLRHQGDEEWCGTDRQPEVGSGCEGGPKEVRVCGMCGILYDNSVPHFRQLVA